MKLFGIILAAAIILAALKVAIVVLLIGLVLALLWGLYYRTQVTVGFLAYCVIGSLMERHPLACIGMVTLLIVAGAARRERG